MCVSVSLSACVTHFCCLKNNRVLAASSHRQSKHLAEIDNSEFSCEEKTAEESSKFVLLVAGITETPARILYYRIYWYDLIIGVRSFVSIFNRKALPAFLQS